MTQWVINTTSTVHKQLVNIFKRNSSLACLFVFSCEAKLSKEFVYYVKCFTAILRILLFFKKLDAFPLLSPAPTVRAENEMFMSFTRLGYIDLICCGRRIDLTCGVYFARRIRYRDSAKKFDDITQLHMVTHDLVIYTNVCLHFTIILWESNYIYVGLI